MTSCSPLKVSQRETMWQAEPPAFTLVSCSAYSSPLKMEAICSSETSVEFKRTTRPYVPENITFYNHRCEILEFYKWITSTASAFDFVHILATNNRKRIVTETSHYKHAIDVWFTLYSRYRIRYVCVFQFFCLILWDVSVIIWIQRVETSQTAN
jgi:hypothetical protein